MTLHENKANNHGNTIIIRKTTNIREQFIKDSAADKTTIPRMVVKMVVIRNNLNAGLLHPVPGLHQCVCENYRFRFRVSMVRAKQFEF